MNNYTIYRLAIYNKAQEEQILNHFNGTNDLILELKNYYDYLSQDKIEYFDNKGNKRTFSITSKIDFDKEGRKIIVDLDSAFTGERFNIMSNNNRLIHSVSIDELQSRKLFSFLHIQKNTKYGYIAFENKSNHGVKIIFERMFNKFLKERGYEEFKLVMSPGLNFNYLSNMIEKGKLKKVRLINYRYSEQTQLSLWGDIIANQNGEESYELKFPSKIENSFYKKELSRLFFSKINNGEKINFVNQYEVDEISFEINYNNSSKTFYLKDRGKMRSNIDVSRRLEFVNEEATYESKKRVALELINEIVSYVRTSVEKDDEIEANILDEKKLRAEKNAKIFLNSKELNIKSTYKEA